MKYYFSPVSGVVYETKTPNANKNRIVGNTPELAIKYYFAEERKRIDREEKEALARLSKDIMADLADRD
jgi:hypothetical protein